MPKRTKPTTLRIGSVSSGTMRPEDLVHAFLNALDNIRLTQEERKQVRAVVASGSRRPGNHDSIDEDLSTLFDILNNHCPDYCYFGAHEGDGADYGCWVNQDWQDDNNVFRSGNLPGEDYLETKHARETREYWAYVNDHGNVTLYRRAGNRWIEVWSVV